MTLRLPVWLVIAAFAFAGLAQGQPLIDGSYIGWQPLGDLTPDEDGDAWFRIHHLKVKGDAISIEASPRVIKAGKVIASASEGGFLTYKGELYRRGEEVRIKMRVVEAQYVPVPADGWPELDLPITIKDKVTFTLDNVIYTLQQD